MFQGKSSAALFILDKDIDDVLHKTVFSDHIVYTEHYSVENYLFIHGELARAAAAASSLHERVLAGTIGDGVNWRRQSALAWKEWVVFCILVQKYEIPHRCNFRLAASTINNPLDGPTDVAAASQCKVEIAARSGMTPERFDRAYRAIVRFVDAVYARGEHDRIFKGKWYIRLLETAIQKAAAGQPYSSHGISNRVQGSVTATVDFSAPWAEHFKGPMRGLVARM